MRSNRFSCRPAVLSLVAACALSASPFSWAQSGTSSDVVQVAQVVHQTLRETVITATRSEQPLTDVLADVTVIDRSQIERSAAVNIAELLQRQPGMELSRNGGPGASTSFFLRGADTRFTAVYVDGVRVDSQATGGAPWEAIALGQIDRVEILRGPAAAIYGSDAVAGVVQIFTRQGEGPFTPYVGVGVGNRRTGKLEAGFSGKQDAVDYSLGLERSLSRGYNSMPLGGNPDRDGYRQTAVHGRLGWQIHADHRIDLSGSHVDMDSEYDGFVPDLDDHSVSRLSTLGASWAAQWTQAYSTRLSVSESQQRYETRPSPYLTTTRLRDYLLQNEWRQGAHRISLNLERREDHLKNDPIDRGRHQNAIALGYGYTRDAHTLQLNLRHDRDSEFGGQTTGGLAYGYAFAPGWRATVAAGPAFRVPTLYHRFSEYGSPGLQPEKSRNVELGLHWSQGSSSLGVTAYRNRVRNLINFGAPGPCAGAFGCYENAGSARMQGISISGSHRVADVNLSGSLDLQQPKNADTGKLLARRAQRLLKLAADTRVADWTVGGEWQLSGRRWDDAANTSRLGGYGLLNLYASTTIARQWELLARIDNLTDKNYQLAGGYATPGRTFFVGLRWTPR